MFEITSGNPKYTKIRVIDDEAGAGGGYHSYAISGTDVSIPSLIFFQKGPIKEAGSNGAFIEDLIQICIHRLECFQKGEFSCDANANALMALQNALAFLVARTKDREDRNVVGLMVK